MQCCRRGGLVSGPPVFFVFRLSARGQRSCLRGRQIALRKSQGRRSHLAAAPRRPGLVGSIRTRAFHGGFRRPRGVGSGSGERARTGGALGRGAPGLVPQGGWPGGSGPAASLAPSRSEKIRLCSRWRASVGARALRFLRCRGRAPWRRLAADPRGRCDHARAYSARRCREASRGLPVRTDPGIRPAAHSRPRRAAAPDCRSVRGRGALDRGRCA